MRVFSIALVKYQLRPPFFDTAYWLVPGATFTLPISSEFSNENPKCLNEIPMIHNLMRLQL